MKDQQPAPDFFCKTCNKPAAKIIETYLSPVKESREWDGTCYALTDDYTLDDSDIGTTCAVCGTILE